MSEGSKSSVSFSLESEMVLIVSPVVCPASERSLTEKSSRELVVEVDEEEQSIWIVEEKHEERRNTWQRTRRERAEAEGRRKKRRAPPEALGSVEH